MPAQVFSFNTWNRQSAARFVERSANVQMQNSTQVLLIAGGQGTRLWPKSRRSTPKQFMSLHPYPSLFQQALARIEAALPDADLHVVAAREYEDLIHQQAPALNNSQLILEPVAHGTLAAAAFALLHLLRKAVPDNQAIVMLPADTYIDNHEAFGQCLAQGVEAAKTTQGIVTIGVKPTFPSTGFGYIQTDKSAAVNEEKPNQQRRIVTKNAVPVARFVEKPDRENAALYLKDDRYFWNAGIFIWTVGTLTNLFRQHQPELFTKLEMNYEDLGKWDQEQQKRWYTSLPKAAIENAVVEQASELWMIPATFDWADLGTWPEFLSKVEFEHTQNNVFSVDSRNSLAYSDHGLVALFGVRDLIVIHSGDAVFVCHRDMEPEVKRYLASLEKAGFTNFL